MEQRRPQAPEYNIEILADARDRACIKAIVKALLHTIFFHRYFIPIVPMTRDLLDMTLPAIDDADLETLVDQKSAHLVQAFEPRSGVGAHTGSGEGGQNPRAQVCVQFFEKKRRKTYFFGKGDEEVCWEQWTLDVVVATPRSETEAIKVRRAMERSLQRAVTKIVSIASRDKDHIPPITTTENNPFPYQILINPKLSEGWGQRINLFST